MRPLETESQDETDPVIDSVEAALAWHEGDARAAIATLLDDCRHLRMQLVLASGAMSKGMTRGWQPAADRTETDHG